MDIADICIHCFSCSLKYLNVSANALENIPPSSQSEESLSTLQELYLTGNNLKENCGAQLVGHQNLRVLHIAYNQLLSFPARCVIPASAGKSISNLRFIIIVITVFYHFIPVCLSRLFLLTCLVSIISLCLSLYQFFTDFNSFLYLPFINLLFFLTHIFQLQSPII